MEKEIVIHPVVLCGGSGTRLWPLSRQSFPKQFVPLVGDKSLLQLTLERVAGLGPQVVTVSAEEHRFMVSESLDLAKVQGPLILEPQPRNTAAAMALAALWLQNVYGEQALVLFCPADHHIPDSTAFNSMVQQGVVAAQTGAVVTFGVVPSFPSTAYGYIQQGAERPDGSSQVAHFIEKPEAEKAQSLLLQGHVIDFASKGLEIPRRPTTRPPQERQEKSHNNRPPRPVTTPKAPRPAAIVPRTPKPTPEPPAEVSKAESEALPNEPEALPQVADVLPDAADVLPQVTAILPEETDLASEAIEPLSEVGETPAASDDFLVAVDSTAPDKPTLEGGESVQDSIESQVTKPLA
jgi:molybdopterin-guanine dinucleotide biosynthesis protein A